MTALVLTALTLPGLAGDTPASLKGQWYLDLTRTHTQFGPVPKSVTENVITDDDRVFEEQETEVKANGATYVTRIRALTDGKFYPVQNSPVGMKVAITHWAPGLIRLQILFPNGVRGEETCSLSGDGNTMTCDNEFGGKSIGVAVYVRSE